jgi:hypothetical protein
MKIVACGVVGLVAGMFLIGWVRAEERSAPADLSYTELISYGIINAYSTNILIQNGIEGGSLPKEDALDALRRNLAFAKVLYRYANSLKRSTSTEDEGLKKLIADMADVSTYLQQQTEALRDWVENPKSASARRLYQGYCDTVEKKIEAMLKGN